MDLDEEPQVTVWTGWPARPVLTLYGKDGACLHRSRAASFDLADTIGPLYLRGMRSVLLGLRSNSAVSLRWTEDRLLLQESNIRYDLSNNGFRTRIARIKGQGLSCSEEALWKLTIRS